AKAGAAPARAISDRLVRKARVFMKVLQRYGLAVTRGSSPAPGTPRPRADNGDALAGLLAPGSPMDCGLPRDLVPSGIVASTSPVTVAGAAPDFAPDFPFHAR